MPTFIFNNSYTTDIVLKNFVISPIFFILLFCFPVFPLFAQTVDFVDEKGNIITDIEVIDLRTDKVFKLSENRPLDVTTLDKTSVLLVNKSDYSQLFIRVSDLNQEHNTLTLIPGHISLMNVVVKASKRVDINNNVPGKVNTITPEEIFLYQPQSSADLLAMSGNIFVQKSQLGGGSPMIRGFSSNRVLIAVDGVRMNNAIFRSGNLQNVINVDPFTLDKVDVILGPGSTIYGSDAIGGVMHFHTANIQLNSDGLVTQGGNISARYSSANQENTIHADYKIAGKKWGSYTSFTFNKYGDVIMGKHGPDSYLRPNYAKRINDRDSLLVNSDPRKQVRSGFNQYHGLQKIRFSPNNNWDFNYSFLYSTTSDFPRYDRLIRPRGDGLRSIEWEYGPQKWLMNKLSVKNYAYSKIYDVMDITLAHQFFEESRKDRNFGGNSRNFGLEKLNALNVNIDFDKRLDQKTELFYGFEGTYNKVHSIATVENITTGDVSDDQSRYPDNSKYSTFAAYIYSKRELNEKNIINAGVRYSLNSYNLPFNRDLYDFPFSEAAYNNSAVTGNIAYNYLHSQNTLFKINLASGFRAPNFDDIAKVFDSTPGSVIVPNPTLNPEYIYSAELSIQHKFNFGLELEVTGFYSYLDNAMVRRNTTFNGLDSINYKGELSQVQSIQNAAFAKVTGLELAVKYDIGDQWKFSSYLTYTNGKEVLDNGTETPLRHAAPLFGHTHLQYNFNKIILELYANYNNEVSFENLAPSEIEKDYIYAVDDNGNPYAPSWYTINIKGNYMINKNFKLGIGIENITNQRYRPYSSGIVSAGFNLIGSVTCLF